MEDPKQKEDWYFGLEEYVRQGEPDARDKSSAWITAIGLQAVDGLKPSKYLLETARMHIEGSLTIDQVQERVSSYYKSKEDRTKDELESEEADIVSSRIAEILGEETFNFSPAELRSIHGRLFKGLLDEAGHYRKYNISKEEWVLNGDTVRYSSWESIADTVEYDLDRERDLSYEGFSDADIVKRIASFSSGIWQIHPFCEGNTRTTAVFIIKYLKSMGFDVKNDTFANNSWYFRNALVRANYNNVKEGIHASSSYLERFFENLLLGSDHELKNRFLHIDQA